MDAVVYRNDRRYPALLYGRNLRFPENSAAAPGRIALCSSPAEVRHALQEAVSHGLRPTVRSGGHCYENFTANNPGGMLLDLSLLNRVSVDTASGRYCVEPGAVLGDVYQALYKRNGVTLPAGSCYTVGAGGHISGGGYGVLSRLHGLSSDWLSAADMLTVTESGRIEERHIHRTNDPELFRACRGAGSAGFGIITAYYFDKLPAAPHDVIESGLHFPLETMSEEAFTALLVTYGDYWATRGRDADTWGLFTILSVGSHRGRGNLNMYIQFCQPNGITEDCSVLSEFLKRFEPFKPVSEITSTDAGDAAKQTTNSYHFERGRIPWLISATGNRSGGERTRAKYKSAYMKRTFTAQEAQTIYRFYTDSSRTAFSSSLAIDSYGGAINRTELLGESAIAQRSSIMKLQWECHWQNANEDADHLRTLDRFYTELYSGSHVDADHQGTPWGEGYEGCYMNYPDADMLRYSWWPELYYGRNTGHDGLYPFLQKVKRTYDPNNVFHHAMSIRLPQEA
ncbi:FAD-dependent oxidoreductase [Silvibacterium dinghuense]|uniref:FAD-binding oxidoreductase n=1 Tax=Silvibacterium dinghuense TaxID=1560006 RepID=A0A4Q1S958_9BACT|nr:FAD-binding oxidoreductase [Silvibacterium dinghuense]RXS93471.1 FAD-binding oxidoreductase [Silvibacterium dinghuense]GGH06130.1 oxidoreductase [Silvibacterium dinghuense]